MDFFSSTRILEYVASKREKFTNDVSEIPAPSPVLPDMIMAPGSSAAQNTIMNKFAIFSLGGVISFVISVLIGLTAVYLSWSCNSALQYDLGLKVFFAILAYIFGLLYIIFYIIMRWDTCSYIKKNAYY
jgi:hypothetical protein|uniref:Uncharacterized protein n=1 Tax=viral metagenome TaxID=1070528 RepID=A0A6C0BES1_9ZZZZ